MFRKIYERRLYCRFLFSIIHKILNSMVVGKFRLHISCLDYLAQYAKYKVWVKPGAEMSFLYGNNITKAALARITVGKLFPSLLK